MHLRRICTLLLLDEMFYIDLLGPFGLKYSLNPMLFIDFLDDLSIVESGVPLLLSVSICLIYLGALMLGACIFISVISS